MVNVVVKNFLPSRLKNFRLFLLSGVQKSNEINTLTHTKAVNTYSPLAVNIAIHNMCVVHRFLVPLRVSNEHRV